MIKTWVASIKRLSGRVRKMTSDIIIQWGILALPTAVIVALYGADHGGTTFVVLSFLAFFLCWIGYVSMREAVKKNKREVEEPRKKSEEEKRQAETVIVLLKEITTKLTEVSTKL